jgi:serine/threonine-protein kinase
MVTGQKPFHGDSDFSIMAAQISQPPTPPMQVQPGVPKLVNDVILKAIAKAPEDRFQSADAFRQVVKQARREMQNEVTLVQGSQEFPANAAAAAQSQPDAMTAGRGSQATTRSIPGAQPAAARTVPAVTASIQTPQPVAQPTAPAVQPMPTPPPQSSSHRGLYMAMGAVMVILVLVAAGLYMPKWKKASAAGSSGYAPQSSAVTTTTSTQPSQPAATDSHPIESQPVTGSQPVEGNNQTAGNGEPMSSQPQKLVSGNGGHAAGGSGPGGSQRVDTAELDAVEHDIDQLSTRVEGVNGSLDNLRAQQQAQGLGLRGDIASRQASMKLNLAKAQDAIEHNDVARARRDTHR